MQDNYTQNISEALAVLANQMEETKQQWLDPQGIKYYAYLDEIDIENKTQAYIHQADDLLDLLEQRTEEMKSLESDCGGGVSGGGKAGVFKEGIAKLNTTSSNNRGNNTPPTPPAIVIQEPDNEDKIVYFNKNGYDWSAIQHKDGKVTDLKPIKRNEERGAREREMSAADKGYISETEKHNVEFEKRQQENEKLAKMIAWQNKMNGR
jgi:hypothetical protein